jgi:LysR family glycine cleavage system transcriptional activator
MRWYLVYRGFQSERRDFIAFRRWIIRTATMPADRRARRSFRLS